VKTDEEIIAIVDAEYDEVSGVYDVADLSMVIRLAREDERAQIRYEGQIVRVCHWTENEEAWSTSCDNYFIVLEGSPSQNEMRFCAYCGGELIEHRPAAIRERGKP